MDRHRWAVDLLRLTGDEQVLEIGCGPGVATLAACGQLTTGAVTAIDRSSTALERAAKRNTEHQSRGRLHLHHSTLAELTGPESHFDKAFAINVNVFWTSAATIELAILLRVLKPGGTLHVVYETPGPEKADEVASQVLDRLSHNGFSQVEAIRGGADYLSISGRREDAR